MEFTAWEGSLARRWSGANEHKELVEIGAVRVNPKQPTSEKYFSCFIKPSLNPILSDYFIELTGITQERIETEATSLANGLAAFAAFSEGAGRVYSYGNDMEVIAENCQLIGLANPMAHHEAVNAREAIKAAYNLNHSITSSDLPAAVGVDMDHSHYRAHRALDDARAVASVLVPLLQSGKLIAPA